MDEDTMRRLLHEAREIRNNAEAVGFLIEEIETRADDFLTIFEKVCRRLGREDLIEEPFDEEDA
jgi:hypothetical protein